MIKVVVGSKKPVKIDGVKAGFEKLFSAEDVDAIGFAASSGVSDQPYGEEETILGAKNRALACLEAHPEADYFCGVESGLITLEDELYETAWVVILDKNGNTGKGCSSYHQISPQVVELLKQGYELGDADDVVFQQKNSKQAGGSIGILTSSVYTRTDKMVEAVMCALVPHVNKDIYFVSSSIKKVA